MTGDARVRTLQVDADGWTVFTTADSKPAAPKSGLWLAARDDLIVGVPP